MSETNYNFKEDMEETLNSYKDIVLKELTEGRGWDHVVSTCRDDKSGMATIVRYISERIDTNSADERDGIMLGIYAALLHRKLVSERIAKEEPSGHAQG